MIGIWLCLMLLCTVFVHHPEAIVIIVIVLKLARAKLETSESLLLANCVSKSIKLHQRLI